MAQWIGCCLQTKGSPVQFPVRAHAWVTGQVPSRGHARGNHPLLFLCLSPSLPLSLKINKTLFLKSYKQNNVWICISIGRRDLTFFRFSKDFVNPSPKEVKSHCRIQQCSGATVDFQDLWRCVSNMIGSPFLPEGWFGFSLLGRVLPPFTLKKWSPGRPKQKRTLFVLAHPPSLLLFKIQGIYSPRLVGREVT